MNVKSIILGSLRKGAMLPNVTEWKWVNFWLKIVLVLILIAQAFGWLTWIAVDDILLIVGLLMSIYLSVATTDKIGIFTRALRGIDE